MTLPRLLALTLLALVPSLAAASSTLSETGQQRCWNASGARISCAGSGQDAEDRAGRKMRLTDNGNGVIADANTRLVWEKLSRDGSVHERSNTYTWEEAISGKIAQLNTPPCFAGICAWRLPNAKELQSIVDFDRKSPAFPKAFLKKCKPGCSVDRCSCTPLPAPGSLTGFWSSTSNQSAPGEAWQVVHATGGTSSLHKTQTASVRAVAEPVCESVAVTLKVAFIAGSEPVSGITAFVNYEPLLSSIPGCCADSTVLTRVSNLTGINGLFTVGDNDTDLDGEDDQLSVGLISLGTPIPPGAFAEARFDCGELEAPLVGDFGCTLDASDEDGNEVAGTCYVALRYE
ncbi:MAG: DUF1566 domain-containing protein [Thermodesulfobacteriota bacterium]